MLIGLEGVNPAKYIKVWWDFESGAYLKLEQNTDDLITKMVTRGFCENIAPF